MPSFLLGLVFGALLANVYFLSGRKAKVPEYLTGMPEDALSKRIGQESDVRRALIISLRTPAEKALEDNG